MSTSYICKFCNKSTYEVEFDYLSGTDHLACVLGFEYEQKKQSDINFPDRRLLAVEVDMIKSTSNDQELGSKVRKLYYEVYNNS
jgi:hypothetical protein